MQDAKDYPNSLDLRHSTVVKVKNQISTDLVDESVILDLNTGTYYGLNDVGTSIWNLIQEPKSIDDIRNAIVEEYEIEPQRCEQDVLNLLQELAEKGLIEIRNEKIS